MFRNNTSSQVHQCLQNVVFTSRSLTSWEKGLGSKIFSPTEAIWSMLKLQIPEFPIQACLPQRILGIWRWCIWMVLKLRNPIFECVGPTSFKQSLKLGKFRETFHHLNTHLFSPPWSCAYGHHVWFVYLLTNSSIRINFDAIWSRILLKW